MVVEDGVAHSRKITEIRELGTELEVSDGVTQGNQVVITPPVDLEDGGRVEVRATSAVS
jgi:hypothetical protein